MAQGVVVGAAMAATVEGDALRHSVSLRFRVRLGPGAESIPLLWLGYRGTQVEGLRATTVSDRAGAGRELDIVMDPSRARFGTLLLPPTPGTDPVFAFELTYQVVQESVQSGAGFDLVLPVLMVDWDPEDSREELFTAELSLPASYGVVEMFPTVPVEVQEAEAANLHILSLPVVPSFVRLRGREGDRPFLTFGRLVDLGVGLVLFFLAAFGWRRMRRPAKPTDRTHGPSGQTGNPGGRPRGDQQGDGEGGGS